MTCDDGNLAGTDSTPALMAAADDFMVSMALDDIARLVKPGGDDAPGLTANETVDAVAALKAERDAAVRERDALIRLCVLPGVGPLEGRWFVPIAGFIHSCPDMEPFYDTREAGEAAVRKAAGLEG